MVVRKAHHACGKELLCEKPDRCFCCGHNEEWDGLGHIPKISSICSSYLHRGGLIRCVTGWRCYSEDLIQGRVKIPCVYFFSKEALRLQQRPTSSYLRCLVLHLACLPRAQRSCQWWPQGVQFATIVLTQTDKVTIWPPHRCSTRQFPGISGLRSPFQGNHWIVASTVLAEDGQVKVFNILLIVKQYHCWLWNSIISNIIHESTKKEFVPIHKQTVYVIAISTTLLFHDPAKINFTPYMVIPPVWLTVIISALFFFVTVPM